MRRHYWEWPIVMDLFLGGLGGGIFCLAAIMHFFVFPGTPAVGEAMAAAGGIAVASIGLACLLLVLELGQPLVFLRVFLKSSSIICWGARILSVCMIFGLVWFASYLPWEWALTLAPARDVCLAIAGISGAGVMLYTGVFLSSLKAHSFWATPALPIVFTLSALSTACAAFALCAGAWPAGANAAASESAVSVIAFTQAINVALLSSQLVALLVMVLSFLGAGNIVASAVAKRWVKGETAPLFWGGMICGGIGLPLICYTLGGVAAGIVAPVLVLAGGALLRVLVVYSDERQEIPGESRYYAKLPKGNEEFLTAWKQGENLY